LRRDSKRHSGAGLMLPCGGPAQSGPGALLTFGLRPNDRSCLSRNKFDTQRAKKKKQTKIRNQPRVKIMSRRGPYSMYTNNSNRCGIRRQRLDVGSRLPVGTNRTGALARARSDGRIEYNKGHDSCSETMPNSMANYGIPATALGPLMLAGPF